ncbi:hypothetical protein QP113_02640 [Lactobacillus mulieris]|uniref:Uncharacterized protein n=1 Tax=Lactobacillus jensenii TaxID=109790 RepID=A0ABU9FFQ1_LACJE|nr:MULTISPECIES: hypothetical protein [Lactobacillus]MCW8072799.1 hypothetical protein [Lactobacillus mulieris]MDK6268397.1 hypothetical protein [Lactobacillus mulieris]MDT9545026.1 hypothetical protein [Lactobacillus jensenii]
MSKKTDFLIAYTSVSDELDYLLTQIELSSKRKVILNQLSMRELQQMATLTEEIAKSYGFKIEHQISFFNNENVLSTVKSIAYNASFDLAVVLTRKTSLDPRMTCLQNEVLLWTQTF